MLIKKMDIALTLIMVGAATAVFGDTVQIPDTLDGNIKYDFVSGVGTTVSNIGALVVFSGDLSFATNMAAVADLQGRKLASTQMYVQMKLFDELPDVAAFVNAQAAVLAKFNSGSSTEGTLYALSGPTPSWQQLTNNAAPIAVLAGATNLITIVLRYPAEDPVYTAHDYTVAISTPANTAQIVSQDLISPTATETGITKLSVLGEGALMSVASAVGNPSPLSASVDFSIYQSSDGQFLVDIYTVDENGTGKLEVFAWINGQWVSIGTALAVGTGSNHYQFSVSDLTVGQSYLFKVIDEEGREHLSNGAITVKAIVMEAVRFDLDTFIISFNSEDGLRYKLLVSSNLATALADWTTESVEVNVDGNWSAPMDSFQGVAGGQTQIRVPKNTTKAFFKIILIDESAGTMNIP